VRIAVCAKQVPSPDIAPGAYGIREDGRGIRLPEGPPHVMSPFDEQAVEAALRIRDSIGQVRITVITLGPESARAVLKHGLSLGADEGVLLSEREFQGADAHATAVALAAAIRKLGDCDLVLCGRQAADSGAGAVGAGIAGFLGAPLVTFARDVRIEGARVRVARVLEDGFETVEAELPAVVTVSNELGAVRAASLRETMRAARKPVAVWSPADLGLTAGQVGAAAARHVVKRVYIPVKESRCEFIEAGSRAEQAALLVQRLAEARLL